MTNVTTRMKSSNIPVVNAAAFIEEAGLIAHDIEHDVTIDPITGQESVSFWGDEDYTEFEYENEETEAIEVYNIVPHIQKHMKDGAHAVLTTVIYEGFRSLSAYSQVVTKTDDIVVNAEVAALEKAVANGTIRAEDKEAYRTFK